MKTKTIQYLRREGCNIIPLKLEVFTLESREMGHFLGQLPFATLPGKNFRATSMNWYKDPVTKQDVAVVRYDNDSSSGSGIHIGYYIYCDEKWIVPPEVTYSMKTVKKDLLNNLEGIAA